MDELTPLQYHTVVASRLEALEPRVWGLFRDAARSDGATKPKVDPATPATLPEDDLEQQLARHAYRMEPAAHPRVHEAARAAIQALGLEGVPVAIYQLEGGEGANASLVFRPHEAVLALSGNILALLSDEELLACFGHELAHHRLWTSDGGRILVADRILGALSLDAATPAAYLETARRFDLATELYADRGAFLTCGSVDVAIGSLVKVATGLSDVDPQAFLRQAEAARPERGTAGTTHPETVLRAWALARWHGGDGEAAAATLLAPSLDIERLDLVDRERLEGLTRRLVFDVLAVEWMRTDALVAHARQFLVETAPSAQTGRSGRSRGRPSTSEADESPVETRVADDTPPETARFLAYVLLDLGTVDPDLDDESLVEVMAVAREAGLAGAFEEVAKRELELSARSWDGLKKRARSRRTARGSASPTAPEPTAATLPTVAAESAPAAAASAGADEAPPPRPAP